MARPNATERGYGSKWRRARDAWLMAHPVCVLCERPVKLHGSRRDPMVGTVDHKVPHRGDMRLFWSRSNWQTTHRGCHSSVKQAQEKGGVVRGCDADGNPLDPGHHWGRGDRSSAPSP